MLQPKRYLLIEFFYQSQICSGFDLNHCLNCCCWLGQLYSALCRFHFLHRCSLCFSLYPLQCFPIAPAKNEKLEEDQKERELVSLLQSGISLFDYSCVSST